MRKGICYFGSYDPEYARNRIIKKGLEANGFQIYECNSQGIVFSRYLNLTRLFLTSVNKFDCLIVGFPGYFDILLAFVLGKIFGKRVFYDIFTSTYETYVLDRKVIDKSSLRAKFYYVVDWLGLRFADFVLVDTLAHGRYYSKLYGLARNKQVLVYVGSDPDYFYPRKVQEETDVLFYGSYQPLQGADTIIKAASMLPKVKFKMVGQGQTRNAVEKLANKLSVNNVEFVNWLSLADLAIEIAKAKICLGIFGESQKAKLVVPNKAFDAIASNKALITSDTTAAREVFSNDTTVCLIQSADSRQLAAAIKRLLRNTQEKKYLAETSYNLYKKFYKPEKVVRRLTQYILR